MKKEECILFSGGAPGAEAAFAINTDLIKEDLVGRVHQP